MFQDRQPHDLPLGRARIAHASELIVQHGCRDQRQTAVCLALKPGETGRVLQICVALVDVLSA
jgi:hypothetical protein